MESALLVAAVTVGIRREVTNVIRSGGKKKETIPQPVNRHTNVKKFNNCFPSYIN